jgi:hypothetical protein
MICKWLSVAVAVAAFEGGCSDRPAQTPVVKTASAQTPVAKTPPAKTAPPKTPPAKSAPAKTPQKGAAERTTDDFGLPLVIVLDVPETPPEISRPSPPIREEPRNQR